MALATINIVGGICADPELNHTGAGKPVLNLRVATSERRKDDAGNWVDGDRAFYDVPLWDQDALTGADFYGKGDQVIVSGVLFMREYETSAGEKRVSPTVKWAKVAKQAPRQAQQSNYGGAPAQAWGGPAPVAGAPANDPWGPSNEPSPF